MKYRRFTPDFKRSLVEQLLSETAQIMNLSIGAVHMRKSRIKQKLIKIIQKKILLEDSTPSVY